MSYVPDDIVRRWNSLVHDSHHLTPFQTHAWLSAWCIAYKETEASFVIADASPRCNGLLCLMNHNAETRSTSYNATDYTGFVGEYTSRVVQEVADELVAENSRQPLRLWNIRPSDPLIEALRFKTRLAVVNRTPTMGADLRSVTYNPPVDSQAITASQLGRKRRRLQRQGAKLVLDIGSTVPGVDALVRMHTKRWNELGGPGNFADQRRVDFLNIITSSGSLTFLTARLLVDDAVIAYRFGPTNNGTYYDWNTSFDPDWNALSPGIVLLDALIDELSSGDVIDRIDFLRGAEDYKLGWANTFGEVMEVMFEPSHEF